jgi:hypothetical protein
MIKKTNSQIFGFCEIAGTDPKSSQMRVEVNAIAKT